MRDINLYTLKIRSRCVKNIECKRGRMSLRYCSLHERVFVQRAHKWMDFSREKMHQLKAVYERQRVNAAHPSEVEVIETVCDECDAIARQILLKLFDTADLLP